MPKSGLAGTSTAGASHSRLIPFLFALILLLALSLWFGTRGTGAAGAAESFPGQGFLPDNRAWELVSPPDKNGGEVMVMPGMTRPMADCSSECAVSFNSLTGFGDVQGFAGPHTQYIARRLGVSGTSGWSTHGINPPQFTAPDINAVGGSLRVGYVNGFTDDLSGGVVRTYGTATADDPHTNITNATNLYVRKDLLTPGAGSYELLTDAAVTINDGNSTRPIFIAGNPGDGASDPFQTFIFESSARLADAPAGNQHRLFVYRNGTAKFVNQVPAASDPICGAGGPACTTATSSAGSGVVSGAGSPSSKATHADLLQTQRVLSADGSRIFFRSPVGNLGINDGGIVPASRLYLRNDQGTDDASDDVITRIQQSEKTTPESPQPARFWFGAEDGSAGLITSDEGLVDGDNNGSADLYLYTDSADPANDDNLTRISVDSEGADNANVTDVIGATPSLDHVYFVSSAALVAGQPALTGGTGLYHWSETDGLEYIGEIRDLLNAGNLTVNTVRLVGSHTVTTNDTLKTSRVSESGHLLFSAADSSGFDGVGGFEGYDHGDSCNFTQSSPADDPDACRQLFLYSPDDGTLDCVSCNPSGAPAKSAAYVNLVRGNSGVFSETRFNHPLSEDGRYVFFMTSDSLVPEDTNGPCDAESGAFETVQVYGRCIDVYQYDNETDQVRLLSSGDSPSGSFFLDATDDGSVVFIATRAPLSAWDIDQARDIYAAVKNGGFPEPVAEEPCVGADQCRGPSADGPDADEPGSSGFVGDGNVPGSPPDCTSKEKKLEKAEKKLKQAKKKLKKAKGKKATKKAKRAKKRAKSKVNKAERKLERCLGGNS